MAYTGIGRFVVRGVTGSFDTTTGFVVGAVTITSANTKMISASYRDDFSATEHRDGTGSVFAVTFSEPVKRLSIRWTPMSPAASGTLALAKTNMVLPDPGDAVTLAGFGNTNFDGAWVYTGGGDVSLSSDATVEVAMELSRYVDTAVVGGTSTFS